MSTQENNPNPQPAATREVTVTVPEHRAEQFQALSRRILAVWEYRDAYGEPGFGRYGRRGRGRHRHGRLHGCHGHQDQTEAGAETQPTVA